MSKMLSISLVGVFLFSFLGCANLELEKEKILKDYSLIMKSFQEKNIEAVLPYLPDEFTMIVDGEVSTLTKEEWQQQVKSVFEFMDLQEVTNIREPVVNISRDGDVAWMILNEKSKQKITDSEKLAEFLTSLPDEEREDAEEFWQKEESIEASLIIWRKENSQWVIDTVASTDKKE